jgi:hypothetical protein
VATKPTQLGEGDELDLAEIVRDQAQILTRRRPRKARAQLDPLEVAGSSPAAPTGRVPPFAVLLAGVTGPPDDDCARKGGRDMYIGLGTLLIIIILIILLA